MSLLITLRHALYFFHPIKRKKLRQEEKDVEKGSGINIADISALCCARITFLRVGGVSLAKKLYTDVCLSFSLSYKQQKFLIFNFS